MKPKRIGILGGISHESTIKYYELIHEKYYDRNGDYHYPEMVIFSLDFQKIIDLEYLREKKEEYIEYLMVGIEALEKAGVEFIVIAANSPHVVFEELKMRAKVPLLSIVEVTVEKARQDGMRKLLLLGIKFTMQSSFYRDACEKSGINLVVPSSEEQDEIERIIFDELVLGVLKEESKKRLLKIIHSYDVDGVILGCTELPLTLRQEDTDMKLLDTVYLHAEATLNYSLSSR